MQTGVKWLQTRFLCCQKWTMVYLNCSFVQHLEDFAFDYLAGNGDYLDIRHFLLPDTRPDVSKMTKKELLSLVCRVLVV